MQFSDLFVDGVIVGIHVSEWRARLGLMPGDIRVDWDASIERAMYLGAHRLASAEDFEAIHKAVNEAKRIVDRQSIAFPLIAGARYLRAERLGAVAAELSRCKAEFDAAVVDFCEPSAFELMKGRQLEVIGAALAKLLKPGLVEGGSAAYDRAMDRIRAGFPAPSEVKGRFELSWQVFSLTSASSETVAALSGEADQVRGLLGSMLGDLRAELSERLGEVLALVARGGRVTERTINSALEVVMRVRDLNMWGDATINEQTGRARRALLLLNSRASTAQAQAVEGLVSVRDALAGDLAASVAAAEGALTSRRRKLAV